MNLSIGQRWEDFVERTVRAGRYGSASELVREGLRLVEEREARLHAITSLLNASIEEGGELTDDDVEADIAVKADELANQGF